VQIRGRLVGEEDVPGEIDAYDAVRHAT